MVLLHEIICILHMHLSEYQQMAEGVWGAISTGQLERVSKVWNRMVRLISIVG